MNPYTSLAKKTIEIFIKNHKIIDPPGDLPGEMTSQKAGIFVTIHNNKELRGCIGTFLPTEDSIAREIIQNAISAATKDYRFRSIAAEELPNLGYEVSVLSTPEQVKSLDDLDHQKYGVLVKTESNKSGLLLPDLKGVNSPEEQISICCQKGGIDMEKEKLILYRFEVNKYK